MATYFLEVAEAHGGCGLADEKRVRAGERRKSRVRTEQRNETGLMTRRESERRNSQVSIRHFECV